MQVVEDQIVQNARMRAVLFCRVMCGVLCTQLAQTMR